MGSGGPARREEESHGQQAGSPGVHSGGSGKAAPRVTHGLQPRFVLVSPVSQEAKGLLRSSQGYRLRADLA